MGLIAAGVAGTLPFLFQIQARMASYDIHMVAWATLSAAAGLWAWQPFSALPTARRALGGSVVCGIAMGLSCLSKNPLGLIMFGLLVVPLFALDRQKMRLRTGSILVALATAFAVASPWYLYHLLQDSGVLGIWTREYSGIDSSDSEEPHLLKLLQLSLPWTFWLAAGLLHPFFTEGGEIRRRRLIPWLWFILILIVFSGHRGNATRYILPLLPAMALVIAQVIHDYRSHLALRHRTRGLKLVAIDHCIVVAIASVAAPCLLWNQPRIVELGWLPGMLVRPIGLYTACIVATVLLAFAVVAIREDLRGRVFCSWLAMMAWIVVLSTICWQRYAGTPSSIDACRANAEEIADELGEAPLRFLKTSAEERLPDIEFLFFMRRTAMTIRPHQLKDYINRSPGPSYIMADPLKEYATLLPELGFKKVREFHDEPVHLRVLWKWAPDR